MLIILQSMGQIKTHMKIQQFKRPLLSYKIILMNKVKKLQIKLQLLLKKILKTLFMEDIHQVDILRVCMEESMVMKEKIDF